MRRLSLFRLIAVFTWTGLSSLGGGRSAYFHDALVRRRGWVRDDEFVQDFTLSQVLPGPNFSNLAVALGYRVAGNGGRRVGPARHRAAGRPHPGRRGRPLPARRLRPERGAAHARA